MVNGDVLWYGGLLLYGAMVGSFLNVVTHRLPRMVTRSAAGYNLWRPPSACVHCRRPLRVRDNLPLLSWLMLRGRAHCCQRPIPWRYPLVEGVTGLLFCLAGARWPPDATLAAALLLLSALLALAVIDAQTRLLPDAITLPLLWAGLLVNTYGMFAPLDAAVIGAMAGYLSLRLLRWLGRRLAGREALGLGDGKLLAALGAWLGWQALPALVLLASLSALTCTLLWRWLTRRDMLQPLAFGPWLALAGAVCLALNEAGG